jgi:hypothetical protein
LCYIALSGGLLLFVSILTSIAQLQSNKFEQRGLETILTDSYSFKTTISCLLFVLLKTNLTWSLKTSYFPIPHTNFTKHGSHNSITFIGLLHCALVKLLRLKTMVLVHLTKLPWFGTLHSPISLSIFLLNLKLLVYYKVLLHHAKILRWI